MNLLIELTLVNENRLTSCLSNLGLALAVAGLVKMEWRAARINYVSWPAEAWICVLSFLGCSCKQNRDLPLSLAGRHKIIAVIVLRVAITDFMCKYSLYMGALNV